MSPIPTGDRTIDLKERERALPPMTAAGLTPRTARSDGLDNVDGGPDAAFYIQLGVI